MSRNAPQTGQGRPAQAPEKKAAKPAVTMDDARSWLAAQDKDALVGMLMDQAMDDDRLRRRLLLNAAKKSPKGIDLATYRRAIDEAVDMGGFVDYHGAYDYAAGIEQAIDSIAELLKEGHAAEVIELAERALEAVEEAMGSIDDSDGHMGGILERLQEIHLKACRKARPDPEDLARRLFTWEIRTEWDTFYGAAETYAGVLGEKGLAVYRKLAEAEWAKVPPLGSGRGDADRYGKRFRITHIMETLARRTGDVEAVVAVKRRDLSSAYYYLQIAETYKKARKHDLALEWAERGVKAFPDRTDSRLREFLAGEYHRRKRHDEAMDLVWAEFAESPSLENYRNLKNHADRIGEWRTWRPKALEFLRQSITGAKREARSDRWGWSRRADHTELVRVFLWEKDVEAAWREANEGGCSDGLWMELAAKRERDHPEDALPIYQRRIEPTLNRKNNEVYAINRGYAASRLRWPIQFGLLNTDCLWIFDEIQLMGSGLATTQLEAFRNLLGNKGGNGCRSIWMSATLDKRRLETVDFREFLNDLPELRFNFEEELKDPNLNSEARKTLEDRWTAEKPFKEILEEPRGEGTIIVGTQVIEAGVDVSVTTLFTELATWASLVQRFGRPNRQGKDNGAQVFWIGPAGKKVADETARPYNIDDLGQREAEKKRAEVSAAGKGVTT